MAVLLCKLALAPAFVVLVSIIARRLGPRIGGVVGGLPVVAGPILLVLALQHDAAFAGEAARSSVLSLAGLVAFVIVCSRVNERVPAGAAVIGGWLVFLALGLLVAALDAPVWAAALGTVAACLFALRWGLPEPGAHPGTATRPRHDLVVRAAAAMVMVVAVTTASDALGPQWSGVLAPFPIVTSVLAGFSLAHDSRAATRTLLRSMVVGFFSFAAFLTTVAATIEPWGIAPAFLVALAITAVIQALILGTMQRRGDGLPLGDPPEPVSPEPVVARC